MGKLFDELSKDYRLKEGLKTCINCGTCTAICPAAEFYRYDPRRIIDSIQRKDEAAIEELLKSEQIWYCGECMSCMTRCPRKNAVGMVIMALRRLSIKLGYFTESEKGRQLYPLSRILNGNILTYGYCVHPESFTIDAHPEAGPVYQWHLEHKKESYARFGCHYMEEGKGGMRKIAQQDLDELKAIFDVTGGTQMMEEIDKYSEIKAKEMGMTMEEYQKYTYEHCSPGHFNNE
ncbi:MAG: 4Fe-4S dicluster domain-containing protein [Bacteroidales bacterium]|nr:4Fe-4S dicluster domain-containing protein [Bacteroidales bacterium]